MWINHNHIMQMPQIVVPHIIFFAVCGKLDLLIPGNVRIAEDGIVFVLCIPGAGSIEGCGGKGIGHSNGEKGLLTPIPLCRLIYLPPEQLQQVPG